MSNPTLRLALPRDLDAAARLIHDANVLPRRCLHSEPGATAGSIAAEMGPLHERGELLVLLAEANGAITGVVACEIDGATGRGWLRGPHVPAEVPSWHGVGEALLRDLLARLPAGIHRVDGFLDEAHTEGDALLDSLGFRRVRRVHLYVARPPAPTGFGEAAALLAPGQAPSAGALHDTLFPASWFPGSGFAESITPDHRIFVIGEGAVVHGYVGAEREAGGDGFIHHLGVAPEARGQGLGRRLLGTAVAWLMTERGATEVALTVDDENVNARGLYESVGFRLRHTGVNRRWER
jgi:ribosomal protein S18 acetylase RimI-like enzyme